MSGFGNMDDDERRELQEDYVESLRESGKYKESYINKIEAEHRDYWREKERRKRNKKT